MQAATSYATERRENRKKKTICAVFFVFFAPAVSLSPLYRNGRWFLNITSAPLRLVSRFRETRVHQPGGGGGFLAPVLESDKGSSSHSTLRPVGIASAAADSTERASGAIQLAHSPRYGQGHLCPTCRKAYGALLSTPEETFGRSPFPTQAGENAMQQRVLAKQKMGWV